MISPRCAAAVVMALILMPPAGAAAHEIPASVTVHLFVRPEGDRLRLLVRAPLAAMRDMNFPTRGPGYLDVARARATLGDAAMIWIAGSLRLYEGETDLPRPRIAALQVSLPSDRSFASYQEALAHVTRTQLPADTEIYWNQALLDVLFEYPIRSDRSEFSIDPGVARLGVRVRTAVRFVPPGGATRAFEFTGDPGLVRLDPRWHQAARHFVGAGFFHILDGIDHLLFLLCLVIPFRRVIRLVAVVTAFTIAHSITLIASAFGLVPGALWFPPLIETLIAMSIVYMALENIIYSRGPLHPARSASRGPERPAPRVYSRGPLHPACNASQGPLHPARNASQGPLHPARNASRGPERPAPRGPFRHRWLIAFGFGLVHGFGFSFALRESLQFAGSHLVTALLSFNVGVELGQLLVLAAVVPTLALLFRFVVAERIGTIILSAIVAHTAWHWMVERGQHLRQFRFVWPPLDAAHLASAARWTMVMMVLGGLAWFLFSVFRRVRSAPASGRSSSPSARSRRPAADSS